MSGQDEKKLNLSLDDIIKQDRKKKSASAPKRGRGAAVRGTARRGRGAAAARSSGQRAQLRQKVAGRLGARGTGLRSAGVRGARRGASAALNTAAIRRAAILLKRALVLQQRRGGRRGASRGGLASRIGGAMRTTPIRIRVGGRVGAGRASARRSRGTPTARVRLSVGIRGRRGQLAKVKRAAGVRSAGSSTSSGIQARLGFRGRQRGAGRARSRSEVRGFGRMQADIESAQHKIQRRQEMAIARQTVRAEQRSRNRPAQAQIQTRRPNRGRGSFSRGGRNRVMEGQGNRFLDRMEVNDWNQFCPPSSSRRSGRGRVGARRPQRAAGGASFSQSATSTTLNERFGGGVARIRVKQEQGFGGNFGRSNNRRMRGRQIYY